MVLQREDSNTKIRSESGDITADFTELRRLRVFWELQASQSEDLERGQNSTETNS